MPLHTYERVIRRVRQLRDFYAVTQQSYSSYRKHLLDEVAAQNLWMGAGTPSDLPEVRRLQVHKVVGRLEDFYPRSLRAILLIRLISELEVFLASTLAEVAERTYAPFMPQNREAKYSRAQIYSKASLDELMAEMVAKDARQLTSGGFDEIRKYYQAHFEFDIVPNGTSLTVVRELHTRRHLHVHRAGRVDSTYKHEFAYPGEIDEVLEVSDAYLTAGIAQVEHIAGHVNGELERRFPKHHPAVIFGQKQTIELGDFAYNISVTFRTEQDLREHLDLERVVVRRPGSTFSAILLSATTERLLARWTVAGSKVVVGEYIGTLYKLDNAGFFRTFECLKIGPPGQAG